MEIGFLVFEAATQLDFTGPMELLASDPGAKIHTPAKSLDPILTESGLKILPSVTLDDCPQLDISLRTGRARRPCCIAGQRDCCLRKATRQRARNLSHRFAPMLSSLMTARFLKGKKASTHWACTELLRHRQAQAYEPGRVVQDGNVFTGGGVTAGIDLRAGISR